MSKSKIAAEAIIKRASELGWVVYAKGNSIIRIEKEFESNNMEEYVKADCEWGSILEMIPMTSAGSVWGTDGSGVGALSAHKSGHFVMNKSGCSKRILNALKKMGC